MPEHRWGSLEFGLLGPLMVRSGQNVVPVPPGNQRALLAALLVDANQVVPVHQLADTLWGAAPPPSAVVTVRNYIKRLRQALGEAGRDRIATRQHGYLITAAEHELDLTRFESLLASARAAARVGSWGQAAAQAREALLLWRGEPLADIQSDALVLREAPRLAELRLRACEACAEAELRLGRHAEVLPELQRLAADHPLHENLHALLMVALYRCGRRGDALAAYQQARAALLDDLGIEPGPELQRRQQQILAGEPILDLEAAALAGPGPASSSLTGVPRQLPAAVPHFTGRAAELETLAQTLEQADDAPGTVVVSAIVGTAGIGKTALAIHFAHRIAHRFPDGQLYANLRGFDPGGTPVAPAEAVRGFLDALGVTPEGMPRSPQGQEGLYRSLLAGRRMLIVLDNATDEQQVRPLLPTGTDSLVIVTSRRELTGLVATDSARLLGLDLPTHGEAIQMLTARVGTARARAEPQAVAEIARLCACLPLALAVAAARATARPDFGLAALADEMRDATARLDVLDAGDPSSSVRAVVSWSFRQLTPEAARMFRLLGLHQGPDISLPAAASLAGHGRAQTHLLLGELARAHLIGEPAPRRYAFHDLLRAAAAEQARLSESHVARQQATGRLLDHYLYSSCAADRQLRPCREAITLVGPGRGVTPERMTDARQALAWFDAEHQVLIRAVAMAARTGFDGHAWQIPWAITNFLESRGHWLDSAAVESTAVAAATRAGSTVAQAVSRRLLGISYTNLGRHDKALGQLVACYWLFQQLGDPVGMARARVSLCHATASQGDFASALSHSQEALRLFRAAGHLPGQAIALNNIGYCQSRLGNHQQAWLFCRQAVALDREIGDRHQEAQAWDSLGYAEHNVGNLAMAAVCYDRALRACRELGERPLEAAILTHLGDTYQAADDRAAADRAWQQALGILDDLNHADAGLVRARLASANGSPDPEPARSG